MKRLIGVILALLLISSTSLAVASLSVAKDKDTVTYTEKVLYGSVQHAKGLSVNINAHYDYNLLWDISYTIGEDTEASFDFSYNDIKLDYEREPYSISMYSRLQFSTMSDGEPAGSDPISVYLREIYDGLEYGERQTVSIKLSDFYDYYPIYLDILTPDIRFIQDVYFYPYYNQDGNDHEKSRSIQKAFEDFFKLPMLEDASINITIAKAYNGYTVDSYTTSKYSTSYDLYISEYANSKDAFYFTVNNRTSKGVMDFSQVNGGYGIYMLPFDSKELKASMLEMIYPLDESYNVLRLDISSDQNRLLLVYEDGQELYFDVIDIKERVTLQHIELCKKPESIMFLEGDKVYAYYLEDKVVAVHENSQGKWEIAVNSPTSGIKNPSSYIFDENASIIYNGKELAIVNPLKAPNQHFSKSCGFFVMVYGADELLYYGNYECSLDIGASKNHIQSCVPYGNIKLKWTK